MKLRTILENQVFDVKRFEYHIGSRDQNLIKTVFDPFVKLVDKEMKRLRGKWNGSDGYVFKSQTEYDIAKQAMNEYTGAWKKLLSDYPEGSKDYSAATADDFFKHAKKYGARQ